MLSPWQLFGLEGKTILICGASSGLGRAIAMDAAKLGARLIVVARRTALLETLLSELSGEGHQALSLDLTCSEARCRLVDACQGLDGLVYAAGSLGTLTPFHLLPAERLDEQYQQHVQAPLLLTRALLAAKAIRSGASLVYLASIAVLVSPAASAAYTGAKAFLAAAMRSVALELTKKKIRINSVMYGYVATEAMLQLGVANKLHARAPLGIPPPEAVTGAPLFLLSEAARWITRSAIMVDSGFTLHQKAGW